MRLLTGFLILIACQNQNYDAKFLLAEKFAEEKKYEEAIKVFRDLYIQKKDEEIGKKALHRAALINWIYRNRPMEARQDIEKLVEEIKDNHIFLYEVKTSLAELLYSKIEDYESSIAVYKALIEMEPHNEKSALYQFRIGKSYFYLNNFDLALRDFQLVLTKYPTAPFLGSVHFEIGNTYYAIGKYSEALKEYQLVETKYRGTQVAMDSMLGIVQCLEVEGRFEAALEVLKSAQAFSGHNKRSIEAQITTITERLNKISKSKN